MENETLKQLESSVKEAILATASLDELSVVYNKYLAKKGIVSGLGSKMKDLAPSEKASYGKALNELRASVFETYENQLKLLHEQALNARLEKEKIDITAIRSVINDVQNFNNFAKFYTDSLKESTEE